MADYLLGHYRSGNADPRNIYYTPDGTEDNEDHVAVVFDPAAGPRFAAALNGGITPEFAYALELLDAIRSSEPCWFDHNNSCQEHYFFYLKPGHRCPMQLAKELIEEHEPRKQKMIDQVIPYLNNESQLKTVLNNQCCNGTGFADYAAIPCPNQECSARTDDGNEDT